MDFSGLETIKNHVLQTSLKEIFMHFVLRSFRLKSVAGFNELSKNKNEGKKTILQKIFLKVPKFVTNL